MRGRVGDDKGVTLAELLVAMTITVIFFSVFSSIAVKIFDLTGAQQARVTNLDVNRNVVEVIDRQVRYANAINVPSTVDGSQYVSWQSGPTDPGGQPRAGRQTCYQWRVTAAGLMQYRSWQPPSGVATGWTTAGHGVGPVGANDIFSVAVPGGATVQNRQQLTLSFVSRSGRPPVATPLQVAFSAVNTRTAAPPGTAVCTQLSPT